MSWRLCNDRDIHWVLLLASPARNPPPYGPRALFTWIQRILCGWPFKGERYLLYCNDFFLGMYLFLEPSYYLIQLSRYDQVLAGVVPYRGSNVADMITEIRAGIRPPRPTDSSQSRLLQDPVWNVIVTGWQDQPNQRCELSVMYNVFQPPSQVQPPGQVQPPSQRQRLGKILPRIASFFQFLQNSESEIQRQVNKMNEVSSSTSPLPKADTTHSVSRATPCRVGSD